MLAPLAMCVYLRVGRGGVGAIPILISSSLSEEAKATEVSLYSSSSNNSLTGSPLLEGRRRISRNKAAVEGCAIDWSTW